MKGKTLWVETNSVRVPGKKGDLFDPAEVHDDQSASKGPALLVLDSASEDELGMVKVHCRIKNISQVPLESVFAKVVFQDRNGKILTTGNAIVGDLEPGETSTFTTLNKYNAAMHNFVFEFTGDAGEGHKSLKSTTAQRQTPPQRKGRRR
jgi:hypothetical protein